MKLVELTKSSFGKSIVVRGEISSYAAIHTYFYPTGVNNISNRILTTNNLHWKII